jgi:hypothetical protein
LKKKTLKVFLPSFSGMSTDEAEMEYLKIAQDLDMYGVNYFQVSLSYNFFQQWLCGKYSAQQ